MRSDPATLYRWLRAMQGRFSDVERHTVTVRAAQRAGAGMTQGAPDGPPPNTGPEVGTESQLRGVRESASTSDVKYESNLLKLSSKPSVFVMWSRPAWSRKAKVFVIFVTPSVSCSSTVSTASASGQPSNSHVSTVRVGGSISKNVPRNQHSIPSFVTKTMWSFPPTRRPKK